MSNFNHSSVVKEIVLQDLEISENAENEDKIEKLYKKIELLKNISSDLIDKLQARKEFCQETALRIGEVNGCFQKSK